MIGFEHVIVYFWKASKKLSFVLYLMLSENGNNDIILCLNVYLGSKEEWTVVRAKALVGK